MSYVSLGRRKAVAISSLILVLVFGLTPLAWAAPATGDAKTDVPKYKEALALYSEGKYEASLATIRTVFTPQYRPYAMRMLAAANYARLGKTKSAIDHMTWCIKENPKRPEPRVMLTGLLRTAGQLKQAGAVAREGLAKLGENADLRLELARLEYMARNFERSRQHAARIPRGNPNHIQAILLDGLIFLKQNKPEDAAFRFRQALNLKPRIRRIRADLENNLGVSLERRGDAEATAGRPRYAKLRYGQAEKAYLRAVAAMKKHAHATSNLARVRKKL